MTSTNDLTPKQLEAVQAYAAQHGRKWKESLLEDWWRAGSRTFRGEWAPLQQIRNRQSPSWLASYRLPKGGAEE